MKSRLLRNRDCHLVLSWMVHNWATKCILTMGAKPGLGAVEFGFSGMKGTDTTNDEKEWTRVWDGKLPKFDAAPRAPKVEAKIEETQRAFELTRVRLIRLDDAQKLCETEGRAAVLRLEQQLRRGKWSFRKWELLQGAKDIMEAEVAVAKENMVFALLKRRRRVGVQYLSTRRAKRTIPTRSFFEFSGRAAWYQGPGRPALSEAEWLKRYRGRLQRRRKRNKTSRTLSRGPVRVPRVRGGRPRLNLDLNVSKLRSFV